MTSALLALFLSAPCSTSFTYTSVPSLGAPPVNLAKREFSGMLDGSFVTLSGDEHLSGWKISLLRDPQWERIPSIDRGSWSAGGGLADQEVVVNDRWLLALWSRGKRPMRMAIYDPRTGTWMRPSAPVPAKAWYANNTVLLNWLLVGDRDGQGGFGFHIEYDWDSLRWDRMRSAPLHDFSMSWIAATGGRGEVGFFFNPENGTGAAYYAGLHSWEVFPPGGPKHPFMAHWSSRTGRIAVLGKEGGAIFDRQNWKWIPIDGGDEVALHQPPTPVGPYLAAFNNPGDPIWLLDIDAARWKRVPEPPFPPSEPLLLRGGEETIFVSKGHVGPSRRLQFYDPERDRWCVADLPPAVGEALGTGDHFRYEVLWRNSLLLWEPSSPTRSEPRGGVVSW